MSDYLKEIDRCEVCRTSHLVPTLNLGTHPLPDDLVEINDTRNCREYPIEILFCQTCLTAHQRFQVPKQDLFPSTYHYRSRNTADVLDGLEQLVDACEGVVGGLQNKAVLDIGCNDGSLLSIFQRVGSRTFGIEPTDASDDAVSRGHTVLKEYLCEDVAHNFVQTHGQPDIITFTNVFAHIENLAEVLRSLRILSHANTSIVFENHYLGAILKTRQFDTFYHEHPRTYSFTSFTHIAKSLGMEISNLEFPARYGGNIRVFLTASASSKQATKDRWTKVSEGEKGFGEDLLRLSADIETWRAKKLKFIERDVQQHGKLPAKAFPARAAIPLKILGLTHEHISAVYEKPGSAKIGHYVPGTRIPILSDDEFDLNSPRLLNLAWHIASEINAFMRKRGFQGTIIDIISPEDFS